MSKIWSYGENILKLSKPKSVQITLQPLVGTN